MPLIYHRLADKSDHYVTGSCGEVEAVFNMKGHHQHSKMRKNIAGPYSFSNIKKMEPMIDTRMRHWADTMGQLFAETGKPFDLCDWSVFMAYDIVSEIGFGKEIGFVEAGSDVDGLIQGFHDGMTAFGLLARFHPFTTYMKKFWIGRKLLVATPQDERGIGVLMRHRDKLLAQRLRDIEAGKAGHRVDLLQQMLNARDENGNPLDHEYIKAEVLLVLRRSFWTRVLSP
jgi:cytochrome P450